MTKNKISLLTDHEIEKYPLLGYTIVVEREPFTLALTCQLWLFLQIVKNHFYMILRVYV